MSLRVIMDALPLSINRHQLLLMKNAVDQAIAEMQKQHQAGQFAANDQKREQNLLTYGTADFKEAQSRVQAIEAQLQSCIQAWNDNPADPKPIAISLDSYQLKVLRHSLDQSGAQMSTPDGLSQKETGKLRQDIVEQLPEFSQQENAD